MTDLESWMVLDGLVFVLLIAVIGAWHVAYTWVKRTTGDCCREEHDDDG